jgi:hypothetical protein
MPSTFTGAVFVKSPTGWMSVDARRAASRQLAAAGEHLVEVFRQISV